MAIVKPQLILTGGTLTSSRNAEGLLEPSAHSLNDALARAGFDAAAAVRPYTIDSIDFDIGEHYPKLRDAAVAALDAGNTPVVCGGTDTLAWYATLLTKDLMRRGRLQPGSGEKVVFLSSMKSFEEAPELVESALKAGRLLAAQSDLSGGFAICAEQEDANLMTVHDVLNHFDKVSSSRVNPFRSDIPVGYISADTFNQNASYQPPATAKPGRNHGYARIAPPLLGDHSSAQAITYLAAMAQSQPPFDGVLVEGDVTGDDNVGRLQQAVRALTQQGMRVVFCNPVRFNDQTLNMQPARSWWQNQHIQALKDAGAEFVTAQPKDVYLDMMLTTPPRRRRTPAPDGEAPHAKALGVRYVPDGTVMRQSIDTLAPSTDSLVFSALLNGVMPDHVFPALDAHKATTRYLSGFEYNGSRYVTREGTVAVESASDNPYAAGQKTMTLVAPQHKPLKMLITDLNAERMGLEPYVDVFAENGPKRRARRAPRSINTDRPSSGNSGRSP